MNMLVQTIPKYKTRIYKLWIGMRSRCNNLNDKKSHLWAAKGIKICNEWNDFEVFKKWAYNNGYIDEDIKLKKMDKLSLDRIDANKDYCPENCRWISLRENSYNVVKNRQNKIEELLNKKMKMYFMVGNDYY